MRRIGTARAVLLALYVGLALGAVGCSIDDPVFPRARVTLLEINYGAADVLAHQSRGTLSPGTPVFVDVLKNAYVPPPAAVDTTASRTTNTTADGTITRSTLSDDDTDMATARRAPAITTANEVSPFGKVILQQIGSRWVNLGFNVVGGFARPHAGQAVLTGQYIRTGGHVLVNLRLVDAGSGRVLAAYDYTIPVTGQVNDLLRDDGSVGIMGTGINLY